MTITIHSEQQQQLSTTADHDETLLANETLDRLVVSSCVIMAVGSHDTTGSSEFSSFSLADFDCWVSTATIHPVGSIRNDYCATHYTNCRDLVLSRVEDVCACIQAPGWRLPLAQQRIHSGSRRCWLRLKLTRPDQTRPDQTVEMKQ